MNNPNRRNALKSTAAIAACSLSNTSQAGPGEPPSSSSVLTETPCLTDARHFYTVARGNPKPHTLTGEDLVRARMTPESWRLEIATDNQTDPPLITQKSSCEKPRLIQDRNAITYEQLLEMGKSKGVKFIKAIQCLNIPAPLGQGLWEGVPLRDVIGLCGRMKNVRRIYYWGFHNNDPKQIFQSSLSYSQVFETSPGDLPVFLAYRLNGKPITPLRGGPVRVIVPWAYGFKSIKWLHRLVLTNDPRANDTYATQNNDPDSPLKTAAYLSRDNQKSFDPGEAIHFSGLVISGISGLKTVETLVRKRIQGEPPLGPDADEILNGKWVAAMVQQAPDNWKAILPVGVSPGDLLGFDRDSGKPASWPLRFGMTGWQATVKEKLEPGHYEFRVRAVDHNGYAQPDPRPLPKSGRNEIPVFRFTVAG
ncbi:MAG: molybdopterin-dependent oxidoreductase [Planctomycetota bacterium]|nr:molybdopterin-dependent oxidoreductase [Planctomycetota bacterium]